MKPTYLIFFVFLILALSCTGDCAAASPGASANTNQNPGYWIHLDPVTDKHMGDSFFISGTTNIPAGETMKIGMYNTLMDMSWKPHIRWSREDIVTVREGAGENNTFTTPLINPLIDITGPEFDNGTHEKVWVEGEYLIAAEYSGDTHVAGAALFNILENETSPVTSLLVTLPKKSPVSSVFAIISLGIIGSVFIISGRK